MIRDFHSFERLYESRVFEGLIDQYERDLTDKYREDMSDLSPILQEYENVRTQAVARRIDVSNKINQEADGEELERLNNELVKVNNDEQGKLEQVKKKLADWAADKSGVVKTYMTSRAKQTDMEVLEEELQKQMNDLSDTQKERYEEMIEASQKELAALGEKIEQMLAGEAEDLKDKDEEAEDARKEKGEAEQDYDGDGNVTGAEKTVKGQKDREAEKDPLNTI